MQQETIIALIAILALIVTLQQLSVQRKHNRLSVKPYLIFHRITKYDSPQLIIELNNSGLGPAIIKEVRYFIDEIEYVTNKNIFKWIDILEKVNINAVKVFENNLCQDSLSAGETKNIVSADIFEGQIVNVEDLYRINIQIRYESIYNESYVISLNEDLI